MKAVVGVFESRGDARRVLLELRATGLAENRLALLVPGNGVHGIDAVPVSSAEQPGMGKTVAGAVGATAGIAGGLELGAAAGAIVPGVGPVVVTGIVGAALLGLAGGRIGAAVGSALENAVTEGLPEDEIFVYEDALRQGRSVVVALANSDPSAEFIRHLMLGGGAETVDDAREKWWIGLRDAEREHYTAPDRDFVRDEKFYRLGFQAALHARTRGKEYDQVLNELAQDLEELKRCHPGVEVEEPFRRGYERGRAYYEFLRTKTSP
jgi:hypothetical protein